MKKYLFFLSALLAAASCKEAPVQPRPTLPLVYAIAADTAGVGSLVARTGHRDGAIAIIGEPETAIRLARRFQACDVVDNVDGKAVRDSLPDFAGETFAALMDRLHAPYGHYCESDLDSLRGATVLNAVFAWDSLCFRSATDTHPMLHKQPAKLLILTSSLQAGWGKFDVDTLLELCGGKCPVLSAADVLLEQAHAAGARSLAVWTSREVRDIGCWQDVFGRKQYPDSFLEVISPDTALDVRTEFRNLLRQYQHSGRVLDALLLDRYTVDVALLQSELRLIQQGGGEENESFRAMLAPDFSIWDPASSLIRVTYQTLRENGMFTHRISRPAICYYETTDTVDGMPLLLEASASYALRTYVPDFNQPR